ncbi:MAG: S-layer homology domain-containing protein [Ruminococcaceae bacterium]|nr:S-layer homology domain-containing protein [Oscillospiraceae bacterium]
MRKRMQMLALFLVIAIFSSLTVSVAASGATLTYAGGNTVFRLTGSSEIARAGQNVTLKVTVPNGTPEMTDDEIIYIRQTYTEADGSYTFAFELETSGDAQATISVEDVREDPIDLYKSTDAEMSQALAAADSGIYSAVQNATHAKVLMVNPAAFSADGLLTRVIDSAADGYYQAGGLSAFTDAYRTALFMVAVKNAGSAQDVLDALAAYADVITLSGKHAGTTFADYSDADKTAVLDVVKGKEYTSEAMFVDAVFEAVVMKELAAAYSDNEKYGVISDNNDFLAFDLAKYESLGSYFTSFQEQVFDGLFTDKATLLGVCESVYNTILSNMTTDDDRGGSGGGGGGGFAIKIPEDTETPDDDPTTDKVYFTDLGAHTWAHESIQYLAAAGVVSGKGNNLFCPDDTVTRGEFIKMLVGTLGLVDSSTSSDFTDVPSTHWAYQYVSSAVKAGITDGIGDSLFDVNAQITRQDMAVMCHRALEYIRTDLSSVESVQFADESSVSAYAKNAVGVLAGLGIINGKGNNQFDPQSHATRAEAAKVVYLLRGRG